MKSYLLLVPFFLFTTCLSCQQQADGSGTTNEENAPMAVADTSEPQAVIQQKSRKAGDIVAMPDQQVKTMLGDGFLENKWKKGIDFFATGNEPSWMVNMDFEGDMTIKDMTGIDLTIPTPKRKMSGDGETKIFQANLQEGGIMILTISPVACMDKASGKTSYFTANLRIKTSGDQPFTEYSGCGQYVPHPLLIGRWDLTHMNNRPVTLADFENNIPYFRFNTEIGTVVGSEGCNRITGSFFTIGHKITFGDLATTNLPCVKADVTHEFKAFTINQTLNFELNLEQLRLYDDVGNSITFKR